MQTKAAPSQAATPPHTHSNSITRCKPIPQPQVALGEIVVAVVEADLPPRTLERNGLGPYVPLSVPPAALSYAHPH